MSCINSIAYHSKENNNLKKYQVCQTGTPQLILKNEHNKKTVMSVNVCQVQTQQLITKK